MRSPICLILTLFVVAGCSSPQPRGEQYFSAHLDDAKEVVAGCTEGTTRGDECYNAEVAISKAKAKERSKKFFGDGKAYDPDK